MKSSGSNMQTVGKWLDNLKLSEYKILFEKKGYDCLETLSELTKEDLELISVKKGHISLILKNLPKKVYPPKIPSIDLHNKFSHINPIVEPTPSEKHPPLKTNTVYTNPPLAPGHLKYRRVYPRQTLINPNNAQFKLNQAFRPLHQSQTLICEILPFSLRTSRIP